MTQVEWMETSALTPNRRNARTHSKKQIGQIAASIKAFGFLVPILVDEPGNIIAGHGRYIAARELGLQKVPVIAVRDLSLAKKRALALADNKIAENAGWDREILAVELPELGELLVAEDIDISITGFAAAEIDQITVDFEADTSDAGDVIEPDWLAGAPVSQMGDLWQLGPHRIMCGDAREAMTLKRLMDSETAAMAFLDPPYNVRVRDIVGRGRVQHNEFVMASGEMSPAEFVAFLSEVLVAAAAVSKNGAVHCVCMDWRHIGDLFVAGRSAYGELLNLAVWVKNNAGQGTFYRSQHELVAVFRVGDAAHVNNIELGRYGRNRSNVWHYAGVNTFRAGRLDELHAHPTVKPIALVADAIKDCTRRGDIVLDTFSGSGTTLLATERVGRRGFVLEIEPRFIDVAIRRWQALTRKDATDPTTGRCFDDIAAERTGALTSTSMTEGQTHD
jgi:DNA modification methylase